MYVVVVIDLAHKPLFNFAFDTMHLTFSDCPIHPLCQAVLLWSKPHCVMPFNSILNIEFIELISTKLQSIICPELLEFLIGLGFYIGFPFLNFMKASLLFLSM